MEVDEIGDFLAKEPAFAIMGEDAIEDDSLENNDGTREVSGVVFLYIKF